MSAVLAIGEGLVTVNRPADQPPPAWARCWMSCAGAEMNVAIGLARLGHTVRWATTVGEDALGDAVVAAARGEGVQVEAGRCAQRTGMLVKVGRPDDEPEVIYYRDGSAFACEPPQPDPGGARALILSGITPALSPACRAMAQRAVERAVAAHVPVWFDLNMRRRLWSEAEAAPALRWFCERSAIVFAADDEAALVVGAADASEQCRRLRVLGAGMAVVKAGAVAVAVDGAGTVSEPRVPGVVVRDPIGAGDAFDAGFLSAVLDGLPVAACLHRGHACAASVCRTLGDWEGFPRRRDLGRQSGSATR